jgi:hypothetical protein
MMHNSGHRGKRNRTKRAAGPKRKRLNKIFTQARTELAYQTELAVARIKGADAVAEVKRRYGRA